MRNFGYVRVICNEFYDDRFEEVSQLGRHSINSWDSQNRLVSCTFNGTTSTFKYAAGGLRRQATVNGVTTYYVYDSQTLIREMQKNASNVLVPTATYLTGPRGPKYRRDDTQTANEQSVRGQ